MSDTTIREPSRSPDHSVHICCTVNFVLEGQGSPAGGRLIARIFAALLLVTFAQLGCDQKERAAAPASRCLPLSLSNKIAVHSHLALPKTDAQKILRLSRSEFMWLVDVESKVEELLSADDAHVTALVREMRGIVSQGSALNQQTTWRREAAVELGLIALVDRSRVKKVIPSLVALLKEEDPALVGAIAEAIGRFGPHARNAIPAMIGR